jgi:hypothetical protein
MSLLKIVAAAGMATALVAAISSATFAADPTPTPQRPTCAERYPADGPAGVDQRLGCVVSELVGHYTGGGSGEPVPISTYLGPLLVLAGGFALLFVLFRSGLGRASRRLAPAAPGAYWLCPDCRSVNEPTRVACYSCNRPWGPEASIVPTAERPEMVQRFGGHRKAGGDRPGRGPTDAPS